jgi:hypothetical protein
MDPFNIILPVSEATMNTSFLLQQSYHLTHYTIRILWVTSELRLYYVSLGLFAMSRITDVA